MDNNTLNSKEFIKYLEKIKKLYESDILTFAEFTRKKGNIINDLKGRDLSEKEEDFMLNISGLYKSNVINDEELNLIKNIVFGDEDDNEPAMLKQIEMATSKQIETDNPQQIEMVSPQQIEINKTHTAATVKEITHNNSNKAKGRYMVPVVIISIFIAIIIIAVIINNKLIENESEQIGKQTKIKSTEQVGNNITSRIIDSDSNVYKTVTIGTQEWMAENLSVSRYRNGDIIPQVQGKSEWSKLTTGAWCYYDNDFKNGNTYGKLYNWYAVNDPRGIAPNGWHIPSDAEWTKLTDYLGGESVAGGKMKATTLWDNPNKGASNECGFTAFPGGYRYYDGRYYFIGRYGLFWSASENGNDNAWDRTLGYGGSGVFRDYGGKGDGLSVSCVRD